MQGLRGLEWILTQTHEVSFDQRDFYHREGYLQHILSVGVTDCKGLFDVMKSETVTIDPAEWLIVEGLFAMAYPAMEERVDLVGYIDASPETRLARRIARDGSERGYTEDEVRYQWKNHVRPADIQFIEPWKTKADVVVDNEKDWKSGLNELIDKMEKA